MTTAFALNMEFSATKARLRRTLAISLGAHAILIVWLILHRTISPAPESIVEIAWLDAAPAPAPSVREPVLPEPVEAARPVPPSPTEEKFERQRRPAVVEPTPQEESANVDRIRERMSSLTAAKLPTRTLNASTTKSNSLLRSSPVPVEKPGTGTPAIDLKREEKLSSNPVTLTRGPDMAKRNAPALAPTAEQTAVTASAAPDLASATRRSLGGAELVGEIADRPVIEHSMPVYPDWAKSQAVEGTVTLSFVVLPNGLVKENVQIQKTAGFSDFDRNAVEALVHWRFAALTGSSAHEQRGTITFRYRLTD